MDVNVKEDSVQKYYYLGLGAILITALVYFLFFGVIEKYSLSNDTSAWGTFGSYFGGVLGPVLSFLAFVILAKTLESQQKEAKRQRKFSQIELKTLALENASAEFESWLDRRKKLNGETIREMLDARRASVKEAETVLMQLVFIAFYIKDLNDALTEYYGDETGFMTLSLKQRWALKYAGITTAAKDIVEHDYLSFDQWQILRDGGLLK